MPSAWLTYRRVSTDDQVHAGVSIDAQLDAGHSYARARGWSVAKDIADPGASASTLKRPGMQELLADLQSGNYAGVIVWRLDRLTRNLRDLLSLLDLTGKLGVGIVSVTESLDTTTPMGLFVVHLLGAIAQWERGTISQRTSAAIKHAKGKGFFTGGGQPAGTAVVTDGERRRLVRGDGADVLEQAWGWVLKGDSLRDVADKLTAAGVPRPKARGNTAWTTMAVRSTLLSPLLVGLLVKPDMQLKVRDALASRSNPARRGADRAPGDRVVGVSILAGLIRCPTCERAMIHAPAYSRGKRYLYFRCGGRSKGSCRQKEQRVDHVEAKVFPALTTATQPGGKYQAQLRASMAAARAQLEASRIERAQLTSEREQIAGRVADLTLRQQIGSAAWTEAMRALSGELDRIDKRLTHLAGIIAVGEVDQGSIDVVLDQIVLGVERLAGKPNEDKRLAVRQILAGAQVLSDRVILDLYEPERPKTPAREGGGSTKSQKWVPTPDRSRIIRVEVGPATGP